MRTDDHIVRQIRSAVRLEDFLKADGRKLIRAGGDFVCCCPFHAEDTPSFHIYVLDQHYKCFGGCGRYGDIFNYLMERDRCDFPAALRTAAAFCNLTHLLPKP